MKLVISKNKEGNGYYSKIVNEYNNEKSEMYLSIQLGKSVGELEYGLYEVDGFISCYNSKDGSVKPKLVITSAKHTTKYEKKEEHNHNTTSNTITHDDLQDDDPFEQMSIEISDDFLD